MATSSMLYKSNLPSPEIMAEYEEQNPGTIEKMLKIAMLEQEHRQAMELLEHTQNEKMLKFGRSSSLVLVAIISATVIALSFGGHYMVASVFSIAAFLTITIASNSIGKLCYKTHNENAKQNHKNSNYKHRNK